MSENASARVGDLAAPLGQPHVGREVFAARIELGELVAIVERLLGQRRVDRILGSGGVELLVAHQRLDSLLQVLEETLLLGGDAVGEGLLGSPQDVLRYYAGTVERLAYQILLAALLGRHALLLAQREEVRREEVVEKRHAQLKSEKYHIAYVHDVVMI